MSVLNEITTLHTEAAAILRPFGRAPTRGEYASALELADAALDLALSTDLDVGEEVLATCESFQRFCYDPLQRSYARTAGYERFVYERSSTKTALKRKRSGVIFNTDPGEHLVEALQAVRLGRLLDEQEEFEMNRTVRWSDEE
ncbi:hypothetical protein F4805DRAFT_6356 [Annulohypoxylon moriforme]|nr:hypothetical protein F4805DRAFT_6356 [Annulohypoxylon moriforme]